MKKIVKIQPPHAFDDYTRVLSRLSEEDGGGFLITFPDLPGCMSDGETKEEALENGHDAFLSWVSARSDQGKAIPEPKTRPGNYVEADDPGAGGLPFPVKINNSETIKAIEDAIGGKNLSKAYNTPEEMFEDLDA